MTESNAMRALAVGVVAVAAAGAAVWFLVLDDRVAEAPPIDVDTDDAAVAVADRDFRATGTLLAPAGYVVRPLDAIESPVLTLGLIGDGDAIRCVVGEPRGDVPLHRALCRPETADAVGAVRRATLDTEHTLGERVYRLDGDSLVVSNQDTSIALTALPPAPESVRVCRTSGVDVIAVDGNLVHGVRQTTVAFLGATELVGAATTETHVYDYHFACRPEDAHLTWVEADVEGDAPILVVHQVVCDASRCDDVVSRLPRAGTDPMVASIAGQVLLVYAADDGTRMRLAPITAITHAPDLEVPAREGSPVLSRALFARGGAAIVTLRRANGIEALRVDATGNVAPLPVTHR